MSVKAIAWSYGREGNSVIIDYENNIIVESEYNDEPVTVPQEYLDEFIQALERARNIINHTGDENERRQSSDDSDSRY